MQRFEAYEDDDGKWRWRLWAADFELIASSGEAFASQEVALRVAAAVKGHAVDAAVESAPGLGMKAARRLRALLNGEPRPPAARSVTWSMNRRLPSLGCAGVSAGVRGLGTGATVSTGDRAWVSGERVASPSSLPGGENALRQGRSREQR